MKSAWKMLSMNLLQMNINFKFYIMKRIVFISLISVNWIFAQAPVTDAQAGTQLTALNKQAAISNKNLTQQLTTAGSQLTQLQKTYEQIEKAAEKIEKVNDAIESAKKVQELISMQKEALGNLEEYVQNVEKMKGKVDEKKVTGIISNLTNILTDLSKVITNGIFNMTDKERIDYMDKRKSEVTTELLKTRMLKVLTSR